MPSSRKIKYVWERNSYYNMRYLLANKTNEQIKEYIKKTKFKLSVYYEALEFYEELERVYESDEYDSVEE